MNKTHPTKTRPKRTRPTHRTKPKTQPASSIRSGLINRASPRPTSSSPSPSHPPSPRRKRLLLPSLRTGSPGSKDPASSIEEWLSLQLPACTPSARPSRLSAQSQTSPPPPYNSHHFYQDLPQYPDSFYLHPEYYNNPTFDLSSAAFPPVDPTSLFYDDSPPDTSLTAGSNSNSTINTALSSLSDSSYQDQIIGYQDPTSTQHTSCATILHPHPHSLVPVTAEPDLDPIDSLLSSPELSEELNLLASPGVNSLPEPELDFPPMPSVSSTASSRAAAPPKEAPNRVKKRELNTLAARRYRQRRVDRMNQLEEELEAIKRERDELKMRVSKLEGETEALRSMVRSQK
ncbi:Cys/Met metabolism PLP-dependent enzyme family protein [Aspergillus tubingensis]|uniref:BZIP domain-containing protein n=1 Tax=Aspergillus niger TaxID=5061 RepID=A0A100IAW1_ASPNG|nr:Cys/Met metabolism PLP-dependent enzyme family protein [Aspergillus tubingensis]GAQ37849.1 hypothetical protein AKAW_01000 [Aspergillus niger]GFN13133.1 Cys/Met metabolism PLP-dependent enzyme family protein [Aspergillus tubingensis]